MATLRQQLEEQMTLIREQRELLQLQQQKIDLQAKELDSLSRRPDQMEQGGAAPSSVPVAQAQGANGEVDKAVALPQKQPERDAVGDLNAPAVRAGEFPGSFRIPGPGNVSLAIGGFVKTAVIYDS